MKGRRGWVGGVVGGGDGGGGGGGGGGAGGVGGRGGEGRGGCAGGGGGGHPVEEKGARHGAVPGQARAYEFARPPSKVRQSVDWGLGEQCIQRCESTRK